MSEFTPHYAPVVVLLFLGCVLLAGCGILFAAFAALRRSKVFVAIGLGTTASVALGYLILLLGFSLASKEKVLAPGGWKYFCEIDCHLAYTVTDVNVVSAIGPEMKQTVAHGEFVVVRVKTWFDRSTISPQRGDGPLLPNSRKVVLVDDVGHRFSQSAEAEAALSLLGSPSTPLTESLRPGESYTTELAFDVPREVSGLRLLITENDPETRLVIGHENSLLHKKIYWGLPSFPSSVAQSLQ